MADCFISQCRRLNVGGKLLTNYLKEVVSYRQWNMMDEFKIIDQVMLFIFLFSPFPHFLETFPFLRFLLSNVLEFLLITHV